MQLGAILTMNNGWVITIAQGSAALFQRRVLTENMNPIISDRTTRRVGVAAPVQPLQFLGCSVQLPKAQYASSFNPCPHACALVSPMWHVKLLFLECLRGLALPCLVLRAFSILQKSWSCWD